MSAQYHLADKQRRLSALAATPDRDMPPETVEVPMQPPQLRRRASQQHQAEEKALIQAALDATTPQKARKTSKSVKAQQDEADDEAIAALPGPEQPDAGVQREVQKINKKMAEYITKGSEKGINKACLKLFERARNDPETRKPLLIRMIEQAPNLEHGARASAYRIWSFALKNHANNMTRIILKHPQVLDFLFAGYKHGGDTGVALQCGSIIRQMAMVEPLHRLILASPNPLLLIKHAQSPSFETSSDAFLTIRTIFTAYEDPAAAWMCEHYDEFVARYNGLLQCPNLLTRSNALQLLSDWLHGTSYYYFMMKYISSERHLALVMTLLRTAPNKKLQLAVLQVFMIFLLNPKKTAPVNRILYKNRNTIQAFLESALDDQGEQMHDYKAVLLKSLADLKPDAPKQIKLPEKGSEGAQAVLEKISQAAISTSEDDLFAQVATPATQRQDSVERAKLQQQQQKQQQQQQEQHQRQRRGVVTKYDPTEVLGNLAPSNPNVAAETQGPEPEGGAGSGGSGSSIGAGSDSGVGVGGAVSSGTNSSNSGAGSTSGRHDRKSSQAESLKLQAAQRAEAEAEKAAIEAEALAAKAAAARRKAQQERAEAEAALAAAAADEAARALEAAMALAAAAADKEKETAEAAARARETAEAAAKEEAEAARRKGQQQQQQQQQQDDRDEEEEARKQRERDAAAADKRRQWEAMQQSSKSNNNSRSTTPIAGDEHDDNEVFV